MCARILLGLVVLALGMPHPVAAQTTPGPDASLHAVDFLIGTWNGTGGGRESGMGQGTSTFAYDLGRAVVTRRDKTVYPAHDGKPAETYEALMVIYGAPGGVGVRADYYDAGGHVIHYAGTSDQDGGITFLSDPNPKAPTFRLTYRRVQPSEVMVDFSMASPGSPATFTPIVSGDLRRATP